MNSFLGSVNFTGNVVAVTLEFCKEILVCFVYFKADLKGYSSSLIKSRMTLVMKRTDVFREMTLVICSGSCLQECERKHLSVPEGPRWLDLYTYCTRLYVGQSCPSVLCSRDDFRPNVCLRVWPNMCKIFASLLHNAIGVINCCLLCGA